MDAFNRHAWPRLAKRLQCTDRFVVGGKCGGPVVRNTSETRQAVDNDIFDVLVLVEQTRELQNAIGTTLPGEEQRDVRERGVGESRELDLVSRLTVVFLETEKSALRLPALDTEQLTAPS